MGRGEWTGRGKIWPVRGGAIPPGPRGSNEVRGSFATGDRPERGGERAGKGPFRLFAPSSLDGHAARAFGQLAGAAAYARFCVLEIIECIAQSAGRRKVWMQLRPTVFSRFFFGPLPRECTDTGVVAFHGVFTGHPQNGALIWF
jgi:hypothetical protein